MADTRTIITVKQPYYTSDGTKLFMGTSTEVQVDKNGKYIPNTAVITLRLYDTTSSVLGTDYKTVAIRNAGEAWRPTQDASGNYVGGEDLRKTLANRNSLLNINLNNHVSNTLSSPLQGVPAGQVNTNTKPSSSSAIGGVPVAPSPPIQEEQSAPEQPQINVDEIKPVSINAQISDNTAKIRYDYGSIENLRYPYNLNLETQDCIQFTMFRYSGRDLGEISEKTIADARFTGSGLSRRLEKDGKIITMGTVTLPIQPSITDSNGVEWGGANLNPIEGYFASMARGAMDMDGNVTDVLSNILGKVQQNIKEMPGDLGNALKLYLAQEAVGVQGLLSRTTGAILNPNLELLFNGPTLRPFNFTFRLSPRSADEAANVKRIIRFFKQGMSVKTSNTTVFLKTPNIFGVRYLSGPTKDHPSLNRIKDCALLGCDVDYTPDGTYMTFNDEGKTMTSYQLTLRFSELDPIYEDDYHNNNLSDTEIGF